MAKGNLEWDRQLLHKIDELKEINDKKALNKLYSQWIESLGNVPACKKCKVIEGKSYFLKNFDLGWIDNSDVFSKKNF
ncbi:hypothetical protein HX13_04050 [Chryseobacterium sp. P1-3]|uniref:hypothetical protein n=1 Tax=Chryseobacterium sp. (strain P1-3) TaxID=1517683 RepID=UPI0004E6BCFF|nr:hypothetical protein [Chryseobacterium sp. P1-3]KFF75380.1 hypothetical protein HX13_04050 [Chryseobacterium sp. P1-3]